MTAVNDQAGYWPLPETMKDMPTTYKLELSDRDFEARLRIWKGGVRTSAYLLIPMDGQRPENIPVQDWARAQQFYNEAKF